MFKKILNAVTRNLWLQILALIAVMCGLTLLIGASFEEVTTTSKGISSTSGGSSGEDPSDTAEPSNDLNDFLNNSGAFGNWEEFSDFYVESNPVPSKPSSQQTSSAPSSSHTEESQQVQSQTSVEPPIEPPTESSTPTESSEESSTSTPSVESSESTEDSSGSTESSSSSEEVSGPPEGETILAEKVLLPAAAVPWMLRQSLQMILLPTDKERSFHA